MAHRHPNLRLQGSIWHFRRRVPDGMRERVGRREIVRSLRTGDRLMAAARARIAWLRTEQLFDEIMKRPTLTRQETDRLVREWLADQLWEAEVKRSQGFDFAEPAEVGVPDGHDLGYLVRALQPQIHQATEQRFRNALAYNDIEDMKGKAADLLRQTGREPAEPDLSVLARALTRAAAECCERLGDAARGEYPPLGDLEPAPAPIPLAAPEPVVPPVPAQPLPELAPLMLLSVAYKEHEADMTSPRRGKDAWNAQTQRQNATTIRMWIEFHGDRPLNRYTRDEAEEFKLGMEYLPRLHGKAKDWRMPMRETVDTVKRMIADNQAPPPGLLIKTVKRHMSALSGFMGWVLERKTTYNHRGENIFLGHKYGKTESGREMWEEDALNALFQTPVWTGCNPRQRSKAGSAVIYDAYYWLPLLAVFHGLRQEEIAQLQATDIRQIRGTWVMNVHKEGENHVKTPAGVRVVPVHRLLIDLGFLEYVDLFRGKTNQHLWPTLKRRGPDKKFSHYYSQRFTAYTRATGIYDPKRPFHALRATFRTFVEEDENSKSAHVSKVIGHKLTSILGEGATYLKRVKPDKLKIAVDLFNPEIDLSHLRRFDPAVDPITPEQCGAPAG